MSCGWIHPNIARRSDFPRLISNLFQLAARGDRVTESGVFGLLGNRIMHFHFPNCSQRRLGNRIRGFQPFGKWQPSVSFPATPSEANLGIESGVFGHSRNSGRQSPAPGTRTPSPPPAAPGFRQSPAPAACSTSPHLTSRPPHPHAKSAPPAGGALSHTTFPI